MSVLASNNIDIADVYRQRPDNPTLRTLQMFMNLSKTFDNNFKVTFTLSIHYKPCPVVSISIQGIYSICIEYRLYLYFVCKCKFLS